MRVTGAVIIIVVLLVVPGIGAAGQDEEPLFGPMAPARVSGGWVQEDVVAEGQVELLGELMFKATGTVATYQVTSSDPRLAGTAMATSELIGWYPPALVAVVEASWLIEGEAGTWSGSSERLASMGDDDPINADEQVILRGSGAYAGLTAYLIIVSVEERFLGAIIPDEMPELPANWMDINQSAGGEGPGDDS